MLFLYATSFISMIPRDEATFSLQRRAASHLSHAALMMTWSFSKYTPHSLLYSAQSQCQLIVLPAPLPLI